MLSTSRGSWVFVTLLMGCAAPPAIKDANGPPPAPVAEEPRPAAQPAESATGPKCGPSPRAGYHQESNPRFAFCVDVPDAWHAEDRSANGDGFFLTGTESGTDVRAWGGWLRGSRDEALANQRGHGAMSDFRFGDGAVGKLVQEGREHRWIRVEADRVIGVAVTADDAWMQAHQDEILTMTRSLRLTR